MKQGGHSLGSEEGEREKTLIWVGQTQRSLRINGIKKNNFGFQGLPRSKREPAVNLNDGSCTVLGRRRTFIGKDTQHMTQLLRCRKKTYKKRERKSTFISKFKEIMTGIGIQLHAWDPSKKFYACHH